jgi:cysteinyl-tRNA synthetase
VMNITDIDDKIIKRARQNYLYDEYLKQGHSLDKILDDSAKVLEVCAYDNFGGRFTNFLYSNLLLVLRALMIKTRKQ